LKTSIEFVGGQEEMHHVFSQLGIRRYQVGDWEGIARIVLNKSGNQIKMELNSWKRISTQYLLYYLLMIGKLSNYDIQLIFKKSSYNL